MEKTEKKRKWERDYEQYSNSTELDERISELEIKFKGDARNATREELDEHKKLKAIKANLPKVKNILELRGKLEERRKALKEEIARRELVDKYNKATKILDNEMKQLQWEKEMLEEELKNPDLKPEKRAEFEAKLAENDKKRQANNVKFGDCHEAIKAQNSQTEQSEFKNVSIEELKNRAISISSHISQCNLACNKLMQGFSWQSIEVALDKYEGEKLKAKGQQAAKMKQNREAAKASDAKGKEEPANESKTEETKVEESKAQEEQKEQEENALANLTLWQKTKNWFKGTVAKIKNRFQGEEGVEQEGKEEKSLWSKIKDKFNQFRGKEEPETEEKPELKPEVKPTKPEPKIEQESEKESNAFRQYLRDVAEKGMDGVEQEKTEARMKSAREKLEANRAEALKREAERDQKNKDAR